MFKEKVVFNVKEAAKYLETHPQTVNRMINQKRIPAAKVGREWRIHRDILDAYLKGELQSSM